MNYSNIFVILYLAGVAFTVLLNQWLEYIDWRGRKLHGTEVPAELAGQLTEQELVQTCAYENAHYYLWIPSSICSIAVQVILVLSGFLPAVFNALWTWNQNVYITALLFLLIVSVPGALVSLPFELYGEFHIEKKFGFSTMTFKLWLIDQLKSLVIGAVVAVPLILVMVLLLEHAAGWWWVLLGIVYVVFSLGVSVVYPLWIAPLFNKFTPLEDGALKTRVTSYLERSGFKASGVFVMDASKRSNHSNAYFTGFGKSKRVVLYDTLVKQMTVDELGAVLGHELGHYKKHHIVKRLCAMIPLIFAALFIVSMFISRPELYKGFGFDTPDAVFPHMKFIGLFLLSELFGNYSDIASLIGNYFSRRDEYAADAYAKELCGTGEPLVTALVKLNKENKSEIMPPKIYSMWNYSHPTLLERIRALRK